MPPSERWWCGFWIEYPKSDIICRWLCKLLSLSILIDSSAWMKWNEMAWLIIKISLCDVKEIDNNAHHLKCLHFVKMGPGEREEVKRIALKCLLILSWIDHHFMYVHFCMVNSFICFGLFLSGAVEQNQKKFSSDYLVVSIIHTLVS